MKKLVCFVFALAWRLPALAAPAQSIDPHLRLAQQFRQSCMAAAVSPIGAGLNVEISWTALGFFQTCADVDFVGYTMGLVYPPIIQASFSNPRASCFSGSVDYELLYQQGAALRRHSGRAPCSVPPPGG